MLTITRDELQEAVERAIKNAPSLSKPDAERLRDVARTTTTVTRGDWECDGVGCPADQARLHTLNGTAEGATAFAVSFDTYVGDLLTIEGTHVLQVTG